VTRHPAWSGAIVALVALIIAVVLIATSSDSDKKTVSRKPTTTTSPARPIPRLHLIIGRVIVHNVGTRTRVSRSLRNTVRASLQRYVDDAIVGPLERGGTVPAYKLMYDSGVRHFALKRDLNALTESRTGFQRKRVHATASRVRLDVLGAPNGLPALVAATFRVNIDAPTARGRLSIRRFAEMTYARERGHWVVTAYRVSVRRGFSGRPATTTSAVAS